MSDYLVFIRNNSISRMIIIVLYINNYLVFGIGKSKIDGIKKWLYIHYKMKDL